MNIEQARMALQNNDTQGAMMYLDMALSALGGDGVPQAHKVTRLQIVLLQEVMPLLQAAKMEYHLLVEPALADEDNDNGANDNGANDNGANDNGANGDEEGEGNIEGEDPNEFEDCVIVGGRDVGDVGC